MASVRARVSGQGQGDHAGRVVAHPLVTDGARARGRLAALESEQLLKAALFDLAGVRVRARSEAALVDLLRREAAWRLACRFGFRFGFGSVCGGDVEAVCNRGTRRCQGVGVGRE